MTLDEADAILAEFGSKVAEEETEEELPYSPSLRTREENELNQKIIKDFWIICWEFRGRLIYKAVNVPGNKYHISI